MHKSGFTPTQFHPTEQHELLLLGCGITNFVERATGAASDLSKEEIIVGYKRLKTKVKKYTPHFLAILGISAYRTAVQNYSVLLGLQEDTIGNTQIFVLPNPSGLNAHFTPIMLAEQFRGLFNRVDW